MQFLSSGALKATFTSGPLDIILVGVHFHHKHSKRSMQWKEISTIPPPPLAIQGAIAPLRIEYDTSSRARMQVHDRVTTCRARVRD